MAAMNPYISQSGFADACHGLMGLLPRCVTEMSNQTYTSGVAPGVVPSHQQRGQFGNFGGPDGR